MDSPLISVIIPCFNQAKFLGEAIESVLAQSYSRLEVILVDDGSTDRTCQVATSYLEVRYIHQKNQGLSAARNAGFQISQGTALVFLDADDRLLSDALEKGLAELQRHPECAFVAGRYRMIEADGSIRKEIFPYWLLPTPKAGNHYHAFLEGNFIGMHATVMYRRSALESVGGFDASLKACEDYDMYLRISRIYPIYYHNALIAEYRQHDDNMSGNFELMLETSLAVLNSQWKYVEGNGQGRLSYRKGVRFWMMLWGGKLIKQSMKAFFRGEIRPPFKSLRTLSKYVFRHYCQLAYKN